MNLGLGLRNLSRVREILSVLVIDYGFGYVFDQLGLDRFLPIGRRRGPAREYAHLSGARRLRLALGQLGPTFIKLGQLLSARRDLLPPAVVDELRHLQDEAPAVPFDEIRGVIEAELGRPLEQCFAHIDRAPLASASLGQVHRATLRSGREVTVKVLRPGVRRVIEADLQILSDAAYLLHTRSPALRRYNLPALVRQFADQLEDEMVYTTEGHNADRLRRSLSGAAIDVQVPEVIWDFTTREVLTMEHLHGHRVDRPPSGPQGADRAALGDRFARCMLYQVLVDGFFHADPHQGNVLVTDDGRLALLDFGIVGYLDPHARGLVSEAMQRVNEQDVDGLLAALSEAGSISPETELSALRTDLARIVSRFALIPRREFLIGEVLARVLRVLWLNNVQVLPQFSLTAKALLMTEAICTELDPDFDLREAMESFAAEAAERALSAGAIADSAARALRSVIRRVARVPGRIDRILSLMESGSLRLRLDQPEADARWGRTVRAINRLTLALLAGPLVIAGAAFMVAAQTALHTTLGAVALIAGLTLGLIAALAALRPGQV
jgi:ubiquinone biosynthesis protein